MALFLVPVRPHADPQWCVCVVCVCAFSDFPKYLEIVIHI